jgi:hypothetical protein
MNNCGYIFNPKLVIHPEDDHGCILPSGHDGPHKFIGTDNKIYEWEIDMSCECDHCMQCQGDYCAVYWKSVSQNTKDLKKNLN